MFTAKAAAGNELVSSGILNGEWDGDESLDFQTENTHSHLQHLLCASVEKSSPQPSVHTHALLVFTHTHTHWHCQTSKCQSTFHLLAAEPTPRSAPFVPFLSDEVRGIQICYTNRHRGFFSRPFLASPQTCSSALTSLLTAIDDLLMLLPHAAASLTILEPLLTFHQGWIFTSGRSSFMPLQESCLIVCERLQYSITLSVFH